MRGLGVRRVPGGCLESIWELSRGCLTTSMVSLGVWSVSRGCKEGLKKVITMWCPYLSFGKVRTVA